MSYDYHPPLPIPDSGSEQSLGDCAICMDMIMVDPSLRQRSKSSDQREYWDDKGLSSPSFMKGNSVGDAIHAMQMGVNVTTARKHYSLAPCSHLFVSVGFLQNIHLLNLLLCNSTLNVWKRFVPIFVYPIPTNPRC